MGELVLGQLRPHRSPLMSQLKIVRVTDRREVITSYLNRERRRRPRLPDIAVRSYEDSNTLDRWLKRHRLKHGVMSGFRQWAWVMLEWEDLLDCAVVDSISRGQTVRSLGALVSSGFLHNDWEPLTPNRVWHEVIRAGFPLPVSEALILRPALPSELARFYVEDGSGRAAYLASHRPKAEVVAYAYLGFDPDPASEWMRKNLELGYFLRTARRYSRIEDLLNGRFSPDPR
jgi:hypothetical protein